MADLLTSGVELMLLGMGIVFFFLIVLIGSLKVMSAFASQFDVAAPTPRQTNTVTNTVRSVPDAAHIAAIGAAVARFRAAHNASWKQVELNYD